MLRRLTIFLLVLTAGAVVLPGRQPPQNPNIRVATRLVHVDVIVRDKNDATPNLTKDDFTIFDKGKRRDISLFNVESSPASLQPAQPVQPVSASTFSDLPNEEAAAPRSITIVLLDNLNALYGSQTASQYEVTPYWIEDLALQNARQHLIQFVTNLDPRDRVAIYGLSHSLRVLCDFTSDRTALLATLQKYDTRAITNREVVEPGRTIIVDSGHKSANAVFKPGSGFENGASERLANGANGDRSAETMAALEQIADHVANIPGRKNLVWLTANLPFSGAAMAHILSPANIAVYPIDARGLLARQTPTSAILTGTADADDVSGASGHMDNMPAQSSEPIGIPTMEALARDTGGQAFVNTNDITGAIRTAVEDSAISYTLGFYVDQASIDGKFHQLKIEVHRKGLKVRYPRGYFAFEDEPATQGQTRQVLVTAVRSPIESSAIAVSAHVERVEKPLPHSLSVSGSIDVRGVNFTQTGGVRTGSVNVYTIEEDQTGKILEQSGNKINFRFSDEQYEAYLRSGFPFHQYIQPQVAIATLRVIVEDASTTQLGSLIIPLSSVK